MQAAGLTLRVLAFSMYHRLLIRVCMNGTKSFCLYYMSDCCASDCVLTTVICQAFSESSQVYTMHNVRLSPVPYYDCFSCFLATVD